MNKLIPDSGIYEGIINAIEPLYIQMLDLVPMSERGKPKSRKAVLKFLLDDAKRSFLLKHNLMEPFRVDEAEEPLIP